MASPDDVSLRIICPRPTVKIMESSVANNICIAAYCPRVQFAYFIIQTNMTEPGQYEFFTGL